MPEAVLACAAGMRVLGISLISNRAAGLGAAKLDHDEVRQAGREAARGMRFLVRAACRILAGEVEK